MGVVTKRRPSYGELARQLEAARRLLGAEQAARDSLRRERDELRVEVQTLRAYVPMLRLEIEGLRAQLELYRGSARHAEKDEESFTV